MKNHHMCVKRMRRCDGRGSTRTRHSMMTCTTLKSLINIKSSLHNGLRWSSSGKWESTRRWISSNSAGRRSPRHGGSADANNRDTANPDYRSRLVGREIKTDSRLDLLSATPRLEVMKLLLSRCRQGQQRRKPLRIGIVDVKRAYFYAPPHRKIYIKLPLEETLSGEEYRLGRLRLSL